MWFKRSLRNWETVTCGVSMIFGESVHRDFPDSVRILEVVTSADFFASAESVRCDFGEVIDAAHRDFPGISAKLWE